MHIWLCKLIQLDFWCFPAFRVLQNGDKFCDNGLIVRFTESNVKLVKKSIWIPVSGAPAVQD